MTTQDHVGRSVPFRELLAARHEEEPSRKSTVVNIFLLLVSTTFVIVLFILFGITVGVCLALLSLFSL